MGRLTVNKPVSEMTMVELAHNNCFVKDGETFYRDYEGEMSARDMTRELAKMSGYELPDNNEEFDCEIMDDLYVTENVTERNLIALFYRNLWAQAEIYEHLKKYEDTGLTPEQIREIDRLYSKKCRELAGERKKHEWIPCSERLPEDYDNRFYMCVVENHEEDPPMLCQYEEDYGFGFWYDNYDENTLGYLDSEFKTNEELGYEKVVAWMSLPEPYIERSNT